MQWRINHPGELRQVAEDFLIYTEGNKMFALYGPMGVGKTTFIKAVADCLGVQDDVSSPTFAIVNEYMITNAGRMYHFDFYRVKDVAEALDFGIEEYFYSGEYCFMEWPEMIRPLLPENTVECRFEELADGSRLLNVELKSTE